MTLGDLLKRIDLDKDCDKMFILRDSNGGWTNVRFIIQDNEISIVADVTKPFSSDGDYQIPDTPPYKIGDEDYRSRVTCKDINPCETCSFKEVYRNELPCCNCTNWSEYTLYGVKTEWQKSVRYM